MKRSLIASAILLAASASVQADNLRGWYVGGGPSYVDSGASSGDGGNVGFTAIDLYGGYKYSPYIGGEFRLGTGLGGDNGDVEQNGATVNADYDLAYYASAYYRVESANQVAKLYGLLGVTTLGIDFDTPTQSGSNTETGISYGAGIAFVIDSRSNLNIEYRSLLNTSDAEFTSLGISYDFRF